MASTGRGEWHGNLEAGSGRMETGGGLGADFTASTRFGDGEGSNPEEFIGAAHAGCFSMALSNILAEAGHEPASVETTAKVSIKVDGGDVSINRIDLKTEATVPGLEDAEFQRHAQAAKEGCPVSKALAAVPEINLEATLKS
jgi:osmotically inducible protein OsmC